MWLQEVYLVEHAAVVRRLLRAHTPLLPVGTHAEQVIQCGQWELQNEREQAGQHEDHFEAADERGED